MGVTLAVFTWGADGSTNAYRVASLSAKKHMASVTWALDSSGRAGGASDSPSNPITAASTRNVSRHNWVGKESVAMAKLVVYTFISSSVGGTETGSYPLVYPLPLLFFLYVLRFCFPPFFSSAGVGVSSVDAAKIPSNPPTADIAPSGLEPLPLSAGFGCGLVGFSWVTLVAFGSLVLPAPWLARSTKLDCLRKANMALYGMRANLSMIVSVPALVPGNDAVT